MERHSNSVFILPRPLVPRPGAPWWFEDALIVQFANPTGADVVISIATASGGFDTRHLHGLFLIILMIPRAQSSFFEARARAEADKPATLAAPPRRPASPAMTRSSTACCGPSTTTACRPRRARSRATSSRARPSRSRPTATALCASATAAAAGSRPADHAPDLAATDLRSLRALRATEVAGVPLGERASLGRAKGGTRRLREAGC